MVESDFDVNNMKIWIHPALISKIQGDGGGTILEVFSFYTLALTPR